MTKNTMLLIVRIRGAPKMRQIVERTLSQLRLVRNHACAIVPDSPSMRGMLALINPYVAWGEALPETLSILEKAGRKGTAFGLRSPKKGLGRKGVKLPFKVGGNHGYRGTEINKLVTRMA